MKKKKVAFNGSKDVLITGKDFNINESVDYQLWERVIMDILYNNSGLEKSQIYLLDSSNTKFPEHDYRVMKSTEFINMLNEKLPGFGVIDSSGHTIDSDFLEIISKIVGTHLILAINKETNKIKYIGGIKYKILFIDEGMLAQNNLVFKIYQIITDNEEFASVEDERWLSKIAAYGILRKTIRLTTTNISEHPRSILRHLYVPGAIETPGSLFGLCEPDYSEYKVEFKETDLTRINSIRGNYIFNNHDLENFVISELRPEYDYYVFRIFSSIEKTPTKKIVLHISGFTGYVLDREINKIHDLTKEKKLF